MSRLRAETPERVEAYADRVLVVVRSLDLKRCEIRIADQLIGSGTSVGASVFEADEAMTRKDFAKSLAIAVKELNETRFWLRLIVRQGWIKTERLQPLIEETLELKRIFGAMIIRTRKTAPARKDRM